MTGVQTCALPIYEIGAETLVAVLAALDVDAADESAAAAALERAQLAPWRRTLPPVVVVREEDDAPVAVHVPHGQGVRLWVRVEDGTGRDAVQREHLVPARDVDGVLTGEALFTLPTGLPTGYHELVAERADGVTTTCPLVVAPRRLEPPRGRRAAGLAAQLYSVRSRRSWGLGDLADLADLPAWSALEAGADFVQVNPLHAASPGLPVERSPYLPVSRRFASPLYLRVEAVPAR